jgi:type IV secretory pathway TrbL component
LFITVLNIYPAVCNFVLEYSTSLGIHAGKGFSTVYAKFAEYRESMELVYRRGREQLEMIVNGGQVTVSPDVARALATSFYADEEKVEQFMGRLPSGSSGSQNGSNFLASPWNWNTQESMGFVKKELAESEDGTKIRRGIADYYNKMERIRGENFAGEKELSNAIAVMRAMDEIFSVNPLYEESSGGGSDNDVARYILDPYMKKDGTATAILSPSAVVKIAVITSMIIQVRMNDYYDENSGVMTAKTFFIEHPTFSGLLHIILGFLMVIGIIAAVCFYVIQYVMTIFEYAIVTSVGVIFISFCLFDGTKSFTAKLVTLFTSYFIKIMVMNFCLFWVLSTFVDCGSTIMMAEEPGSLLNFAYFLFTTLLCWVVTQNGPAIAVTLLNGSPQLSMGEFLHAAGTAAAGAVMAQRAARTAGSAVAGAAKAGGKAVQGGVRGAQTNLAMFTGASAAANAHELAAGTKNRFIIGSMGAMLLAGAKERIGEIATGTKGKLADKNGDTTITRVGAGYSTENKNADGSQSMGDAVNGMKNFSENRYHKQQEAKNNAPQPPQSPSDPSAGQAKRQQNDAGFNRGSGAPRAGGGTPGAGGNSGASGRGGGTPPGGGRGANNPSRGPSQNPRGPSQNGGRRRPSTSRNK